MEYLVLHSKYLKEREQTKGGIAKRDGHVLKIRSEKNKRATNMNCRVESFGRMCSNFDEKRIRWVKEMGFGGLLNLIDLRLPRELCYWVMTCVDPIKRLLVTPDGHSVMLSKNQLVWVLGIPSGGKPLPRKVQTEEGKKRIRSIQKKYSTSTESLDKVFGKVMKRHGIPVTTNMLSLLEGKWEDGEEDEFKKLFLICSLSMVLAPTQSSRLSRDLIPTIMCSNDAKNYDWCSLVFEKLMWSVKDFSSRFFQNAYAGGAGGCSIYLAILYLDRLIRPPVRWGHRPRIGVWWADDIRKAINDDQRDTGDFGKLGIIDVSCGLQHPLDGRDMSISNNEVVEKMTSVECRKRRRRRGAAPLSKPPIYKRRRLLGTEQTSRATLDDQCTEPSTSNSSNNLDQLSDLVPDGSQIDLDLKLQCPYNGIIYFI